MKAHALHLLKNCGLGFFSEVWRVIAVSLLSKRDNYQFFVKSKDWSFGPWRDYFSTLEEAPDSVPEYIFPNYEMERMYDFTAEEYRKELLEIFKPNDYLLHKRDEVQTQFSLDENTVSIFIRRGDKLIGESVYLPAVFYAILALRENPSSIFVQTDDYSVIEEIRAFFNDNGITVPLYTLCKESQRGFFYNSNETMNFACLQYYVGDKVYINRHNVDYLTQIGRQKSLQDFSPEEVKEHVDTMLVGLLVCLSSKKIVLDMMSNVSRFLLYAAPRWRDSVSMIEDSEFIIKEGIRLVEPYTVQLCEFIRNPRYHVIHSYYR